MCAAAAVLSVASITVSACVLAGRERERQGQEEHVGTALRVLERSDGSSGVSAEQRSSDC